MRFTEALASQAAMVLTKQRLISELEKMFESLIQLIATAIDDKSPYTGGHCRRVPELTSLIAEAAHNSQSDYLKNFQLSNADRYQLNVAGWLHDCGKLTTPEYVVDKATKLETVETPFEVLKRDAEIKHLKDQINALQQGKTIEPQNCNQAQEKLIDDLNFIKKSNTGSEFMRPEAQERIKEIAQRTWVKSGKELPFLSADEILNLNISRGTLTNPERDIIQQHISTTISMLDKINFPKHLQNEPEYACAHHERMNGKGYPNHLTREQMSIPARAMAIADIFEALTAADRPYKESKKLSEALFILKKMKEDNHIDPDIYDAFIQEKVYLKYAQKFLEDSQIDIT
jgi:HD-GYP domain-containing protein (c-di-GMP phosphodiesterase class II)